MTDNSWLKLVQMSFDEMTPEKISELSTVDTKFIKKFSSGELYSGYMLCNRGNHMGTLVIDTRKGGTAWNHGEHPVIVRGYPKIHYLDDESVARRFYGRPVVAEEKYSGTNVCALYDPRIPVETYGIQGLLLKTRLSPSMSKYKDCDFTVHFRRALEQYTTVQDFGWALDAENVQMFFELYGKLIAMDRELEGIGFKMPDVEVDIVGIDIIDRATMRFLPSEKKREIFAAHNLPSAFINERVSTSELSEFNLREAIAALEEDALTSQFEGFVVKTWNDEENDMIFAKVKPSPVKQIYWNKGGKLVNRGAISIAINKAFTNLPPDEQTLEGITKFVKEDLEEEWKPEIVERSNDRILATIADRVPVVGDRATLMYGELLDMHRKGIDITNKAKIMSILADRHKIEGQSSAKLYHLYQAAMGRIRAEWSGSGEAEWKE